MVARSNAVNFAVDSMVLKVLHDSSESLGDIISGSFALTVVMMVSWTEMPPISFYIGADSYIDIFIYTHCFSLRQALLGYFCLVILCCFLGPKIAK